MKHMRKLYVFQYRRSNIDLIKIYVNCAHMENTTTILLIFEGHEMGAELDNENIKKFELNEQLEKF